MQQTALDLTPRRDKGWRDRGPIVRDAKNDNDTMTETKIHSRALTTCEIAPDGKMISLGFTDATGQPVAVRLPLEQAGALAMTLPALIEQALRRQFRDDSLRFTFPLGSWAVEQSPDPGTSIVTLRTPDGFGVCFTMQRQQQDALSEAFVCDCARRSPFPTH
jgi:hypothetical protein